MRRRNDEFILFQTEDQKIALDVRFEEETVWLSLDQMAELFDRNKSTISRHIKMYLMKPSCSGNKLLQILQQLRWMGKYTALCATSFMKQLESDFDRAVRQLKENKGGPQHE